MKQSKISPENELQNILDFDVCKKLVSQAINKNENCYVILCPLYSINIASTYTDGEQLQYDLDELSDYIGHYVSVSDYDDLVCNLSENEDSEMDAKVFNEINDNLPDDECNTR